MCPKSSLRGEHGTGTKDSGRRCGVEAGENVGFLSPDVWANEVPKVPGRPETTTNELGSVETGFFLLPVRSCEEELKDSSIQL